MRRFFWAGLIAGSTLLLYYQVLTTYFSQDDFFDFKASLTDGSLGSFIKLFGFPSFEERGYAFYRPLFREGLHHIYYSLFGLNALHFRILSMILHFANVYLVYRLMLKLFGKPRLAYFTAFFTSISAANVGVLYYLSGGIQVLGATFFLLLCLVSFLNYLESRHVRWKIVALVSFLLGLASHEIAAVIPFLLGGLLFTKFSFRNAVKALVWLWPFFAILVIYLYLDVVKIGFLQTDEQYKPVFSPKTIINSLSWYIAWALGVPEMLVDFVRPGLKLNPSLMRYWGGFYRIIFPAFFAVVFLLGTVVVGAWRANKKVLLTPKFLFLLFWFPLAISPVLLLPWHKSTYYLAPALPALWGSVGYLLFGVAETSKWSFWKGIQGLLILSLVALSVASSQLGKDTFWAATRGRLAEKLVNDVRSKYPSLPAGSAVFVMNDPAYPFVADAWGSTSKQAAFVLNNEDALQLFYKDTTLRVFYEDSGGVPESFSGNVYSFVAKIN